MNYKNRSRLTILSGAGISRESGLRTFRDSDGFWEGHPVTQVATPQAWAQNPQLVLDFYNQRRRQLDTVDPNEAHTLCVSLEEHFDVHVITQNVDDLHERAGSGSVLHLHGQLRLKRSSGDPDLIAPYDQDIHVGDMAPDGYTWRPHIVWFGEEVPNLQAAAQICTLSDIIIIVGTSLLVYPAASLYQYAPSTAAIYYVDPSPNVEHLPESVHVIQQKATEGMRTLYDLLLDKTGAI